LVNPYIQQTTRGPLITAQSLELSSTSNVLNISKLAGCSHEHARRFIDPQHCIGNLISMEKQVWWRTVGDANRVPWCFPNDSSGSTWAGKNVFGEFMHPPKKHTILGGVLYS